MTLRSGNWCQILVRMMRWLVHQMPTFPCKSFHMAHSFRFLEASIYDCGKDFQSVDPPRKDSLLPSSYLPFTSLNFLLFHMQWCNDRCCTDCFLGSISEAITITLSNRIWWLPLHLPSSEEQFSIPTFKVSVCGLGSGTFFVFAQLFCFIRKHGMEWWICSGIVISKMWRIPPQYEWEIEY